jgi:hypothetical protein
MTMTPDNSHSSAQSHDRVMRLLDQFIISDIEANAVHVEGLGLPGERWYDVRPMLDLREHCPELVDMAQLGLEQGLRRGVLVSAPSAPHYVRCVQTHWEPAK